MQFYYTPEVARHNGTGCVALMGDIDNYWSVDLSVANVLVADFEKDIHRTAQLLRDALVCIEKVTGPDSKGWVTADCPKECNGYLTFRIPSNIKPSMQSTVDQDLVAVKRMLTETLMKYLNTSK